MRIEAHAFQPMDFVGGEVVLDFVNTVTGRDLAGRDWLPDFAAAVDWVRLTGAWPPVAGEVFKTAAEMDPEAAAQALVRLKALREALFDMLHAMCGALPPDPGPMRILEAAWREARRASTLRLASDDRLHVEVDIRDGGVDWLLFDMATRAVEFLKTVDPQRLKMCAGGNCAWFFVDRSKAGQRRWCDMKTCGNAAKTRRHAGSRKPRQVHLRA